MYARGQKEFTDDIIDQAREKEIVIISTPHDTFTVARQINQSMPISYFMTREHLITI